MGHDATQINLDNVVCSAYSRLVAAEPHSDGTARLFRRTEDQTLETEDINFYPWLLLRDPELLEACEGVYDSRTLSGKGEYKWWVFFNDTDSYFSALRQLKEKTGFSMSDSRAQYRAFNDLKQQLLTVIPARLFRGMSFQDVRRLQLDIETYTSDGFDFSNARRPGDQIIMISLRDNTGWEKCLSGREAGEKQILQEFVRLIRERDPDVIEGHNVFDFDLDYIEKRCKYHKVKMQIGRDGSVPRTRSSRFVAGERTSTYKRFEIYGRHVVDTLHMTYLYDVIHRDLESHSLKDVAVYFGVDAAARTYVDGGDISNVYDQAPEVLEKYAMDDVRETEAIARILSPTHFYQAQIVPYDYQSCVTRGNAARIDALMIGQYLQQACALPVSQTGRSFQGGLSSSPETGIFKNVWHVDVRSLYPSIILSHELCPASDTLGMLPLLLRELRRFRLSAKSRAKEATTKAEKDYFEALQGSFKVLINSFYGYLGHSYATFNDYDMAEEVTAVGRRVLNTMVEFLQEKGATVVEMDTDGLYFVPPEDFKKPKEVEKVLQEVLPEGIEVELDAVYRAMFAYKSKNYALLDHEGTVTITGAALKSRGLEPFQRHYIRELIELLLHEQWEEADRLYEKYTEAIRERRWPLANFAKREVLSTSPQKYQEKLQAGRTKRSAAHELALNSSREYRQGDQVAFYISGDRKNTPVVDAARLLQDADPDHRDENIPYYLNKLQKLHKKFEPFLANDQ